MKLRCAYKGNEILTIGYFKEGTTLIDGADHCMLEDASIPKGFKIDHYTIEDRKLKKKSKAAIDNIEAAKKAKNTAPKFTAPTGTPEEKVDAIIAFLEARHG